MENKILLNSKEEAYRLIQELKAMGLSGSYDFVSHLPKYEVTIYHADKIGKRELDTLMAKYPSLGSSANYAKKEIRDMSAGGMIYSDERRLKDFGNRFHKEIDADWELDKELSRSGWLKIAPNKWEISPTPDATLIVEKGMNGFYVQIKDNKTGTRKSYDRSYPSLRIAQDEAVGIYEDYLMRQPNVEYSYNPNKKKFQVRRLDL